MTPPLLEVADLRVHFQAPEGDVVRAVDGASWSVEPGRTLGIVGESGSGKSVSCLAVMGLIRGPRVAVSGRVVFDGRDLLALAEEELRLLRGEEIAMVFQDAGAALHPLLRVGDQIAEGVRAHRRGSRRAARARAVELLEAVGIPDPQRRVDAHPHELSGGMRQRAMIAMALANEPRLLLADEPTSALDVTVQAQVLELIAQRQAETGMAIVLVTHDLGVVAEAADDVVVTRAGRVVERAPVRTLFAAPADPYTRELLAAVPRLDGPRAPSASPPPSGEPPLLAVSGLVRHFGAKRRRRRSNPVRAVDGVSLDLRRGQALGLVGETGCGKSTLARLLARLLEPTAGTVAYEGRDVTGLSRRALLPHRREVQIVFQDPHASLNPRRTVAASLAEPFAVHGLAHGEEERRAAIHELLGLVGLDPGHAARRPHELSGGERQRVAIARALALRPRLLIADEPVSALDVSVQARVLDLLAELRRDLGLAVLLIAHDLAVVRRVCDRVAVMYLGQIVELADAETLYATPRHPYTGALLAAAPVPDPRVRDRRGVVVRGDVPSPEDPPPACRFHTRCPKAQELCATVAPPLEPKGDGTLAACHFPLSDAEAAALRPPAPAAYAGSPSSSPSPSPSSS